MQLADYLDVNKLEDHIASGLVDRQRHHKLPLTIYTYSRTAIWDDQWDDVTMKCRGLIVNDVTGKIVARPFPKFFNLNTDSRPETQVANLPTTKPLVTEKLDGSLAILYEYRGKKAIASKGSFHSEHAEWATAWYDKHIEKAWSPDYPIAIWPENHTPVFEMICESVQHHVVHYGEERLVLLAIIDNETGEEVDPRYLYAWAHSLNAEPIRYYAKTVEEVVAENRKNAEGYVLTWPRPGQTPFKVKVKHQEFLTYQKLVHDTTAKNVFLALKEGRNEQIESWLNLASPYLRNAVQEWVTNFEAEYKLIRARAVDVLMPGLKQFITRKDFAQYLQQPENAPYQHICFAMLDEKDYQEIIWDMVEQSVKKQRVLADDSIERKEWEPLPQQSPSEKQSPVMQQQPLGS